MSTIPCEFTVRELVLIRESVKLYRSYSYNKIKNEHDILAHQLVDELEDLADRMDILTGETSLLERNV